MNARLIDKRGLVRNEVLLSSQRKIADLVAYCLAYEFEDVLSSVTDAQRIDVTDRAGLEFSRRVYKLASLVSGSPRLARKLIPSPQSRIFLDQDFELFLPIFNTSYELYSLANIPNWRKHCHKGACFITEVWPHWLHGYLVELLSAFDHIFIGCRNSVQDVARITGRPCTYLPLAVDVLKFAPGSLDQPRPIDVCNIGRRSPITHGALIQLAERQHDFFYYYDTVAASGADLKDRTFRVENPHEHRSMLATTLKRSSYYIANRSYVNKPEFTAVRDEISARFYEGAAAGAVMIGEPPRTEEFKNQFDWPDALIQMPFDYPDISTFLTDLSRDCDRIRTVRRNNIRESALRHDWLHRIQVIFDTLGLAPTQKMQVRAQHLERIASQMEADGC